MGRLPRPRTFDTVFALSFTVMTVGVGLTIVGVFVAGPAAVPGIGIVCVVVGSFLALHFGRRGAAAQNRSVLGSLWRGYAQIWHWIRPPKR